MTLFRTLDISERPSPLGVIIPSAEEIALLADASLVEWLRPDSGLYATSWRGAKAATIFSTVSGSAPTLTAGGENGQPYAAISASELAAPAGSTLLPIGASFSVSVVAQIAASQVGGAMVGTYDTVTKAWFGLSGASPSQSAIVNIKATTIGAETGPFSHAEGVQLFVFSYKWTSGTSQSVKIRANQVDGSVNTGNLSAWALGDGRATIGATNTNGSTPFNGDIYDVFFHNVALLDGSHATELARLEDYVSDRYAIF